MNHKATVDNAIDVAFKEWVRVSLARGFPVVFSPTDISRIGGCERKSICKVEERAAKKIRLELAVWQDP